MKEASKHLHYPGNSQAAEGEAAKPWRLLLFLAQPWFDAAALHGARCVGLRHGGQPLQRGKSTLVLWERFTGRMVSAVTDAKGTYLPPPRLVCSSLI